MCGPRLTDLYIRRLTSPTPPMAILSRFIHLQRLSLRVEASDQTDFNCISSLTHLRHLVLELPKLSMARIASLLGLDHVSISFCSRGFEALAGLHQLRKLTLHHCRLGDGLRHVAGLKLKHLSLVRSRFDDASLAHLQGLPLQTIEFVGELTTLAHLPPLPSLRSLICSACTKLTDAGLIGISTHAPNIRSLTLAGSAVTDAGLAHLAGLSQLTELGLSYCPFITGTGLKHIASLLLTELDLQYCSQLQPALLIGIQRASLTIMTSSPGVETLFRSFLFFSQSLLLPKPSEPPFVYLSKYSDCHRGLFSCDFALLTKLQQCLELA